MYMHSKIYTQKYHLRSLYIDNELFPCWLSREIIVRLPSLSHSSSYIEPINWILDFNFGNSDKKYTNTPKFSTPINSRLWLLHILVATVSSNSITVCVVKSNMFIDITWLFLWFMFTIAKRKGFYQYIAAQMSFTGLYFNYNIHPKYEGI